MNFISFAQLHKDILANIGKIPRDIDLVIGVPRSGILPASVISLLLNSRLGSISGGKISILDSGNRGNVSKTSFSKVLVIDDSILGGASMQRARDVVENSLILKDSKILFCVLYSSPLAVSKIDIYLKIVEPPRIFEWNVFHHNILSRTCMDIDGVINSDPTPQQNDDGPNYLKFLKEAAPKYIPTVFVDSLVTSRLENYRKQTEDYLKSKGVKYGKLVMVQYKTAADRRNTGRHAEDKAVYYMKTKNRLFIESSDEQARKIASITKRHVLCTDTMKLY